MTILRTSHYEGTPDATVDPATEGFDALNQWVGGTATYDPASLIGGTSFRSQGEGFMVQTFPSPITTVGWRGWLYIPTIAPAASRSVTQLLDASGTVQASVWWHTAGIRIRSTANLTVDTWVPDAPGWVGIEWSIDQSVPSQSATLYRPDGTVITTLTGEVGTSPFTDSHEGIQQGDTADYLLLDEVALADAPIPLTFPAPPVSVLPYEWDGAALQPLTFQEWDGAALQPLSAEET